MMDQDLETRVRAAFLDALRLPSEALSEFLADLSRTDPIAANLVSRRLRAAAALPSNFLANDQQHRVPEEASESSSGQDSGQDSGPDSVPTRIDALADRKRSEPIESRQSNAPPPERIADYRILGVLGQGGMGIVYRAIQDHPIQREVALKVLQPGLATEQMLWRFDRERQTLALLSHPGVAQVYDAGITDQGQHYFVMELVVGERITHYCRSRGLDLRARLELLIEVCEAVAHAHQKGVLHRDLKPSNVLVQAPSGSSSTDDQARVKVIDFGIAKQLEPLSTSEGLSLPDNQDLTGTFQILGTPSYMSPERIVKPTATGDTRSDVYSLGVLLFELLAGERPFKGETAYEILRRVEEGPATRPSRVLEDKRLHNSESTDPQPLTANQLGDLDWVALKALESDPARRYDSVLALAGDLQAFLDRRPVAARPPTPIYRMRRFVQRQRAAVAFMALALCGVVLGLIVAGRGLQRARQAEEQAKEQAAATRSVNDFLIGMLASADPTRTGQTVRVVDLLDKTSETLEPKLGEQPLIVAEVRQALGRSYLGLGEMDKAEEEIERSLDTLRSQLEPTDVRILAARRFAVEVQKRRGNETETVDALRTLETELQTLVADDHPELIRTQIDLAHALSWRGDLGEAEEILLGVISHLQKRGEATDETLLKAKVILADTLLTAGRFQEADQMARRILDTPFARAASIDFAALFVVAAASDQQGDLKAAQDSFQRLYELQREVLGNEHPTTLDSAYNLSLIMARNNHSEAAQELAMEIFKTRRQVFGPDHPRTLSSQIAVGYNAMTLHDLETASKNLAAGYAGSARVLGDDHPQTRNARDLYANCLYLQGDLELAQKELQQTIRLASEEPSPALWGNRGLLGRIRMFRGDAAEGLLIHRQLLRDWAQLVAEDHPQVLLSQALVATTAAAAGDRKLSQEAFEKASSGLQNLIAKDSTDALEVGTQLIEASLVRGDLDSSRRLVDQLVALDDGKPARAFLIRLRELERDFPETAAPELIRSLESLN